MKTTAKLRTPVPFTSGIRERQRKGRAEQLQAKYELKSGDEGPICGSTLAALEARLALISGGLRQ